MNTLQFNVYLVEYYRVVDIAYIPLSEIIRDIPNFKFLDGPFDDEDCG
jgi:hypothetical protein